MLEMKCKIGE